MLTEDDTFDALKNPRYYNQLMEAWVHVDDDNEFHRENGPAIVWDDGCKDWFYHGLKHRTDGPAVEYNDGDKEWWVNGKLHREDGPAIKWANGYKSWWINGEPLTEAEFNIRCNTDRQNIPTLA